MGVRRESMKLSLEIRKNLLAVIVVGLMAMLATLGSIGASAIADYRQSAEVQVGEDLDSNLELETPSENQDSSATDKSVPESLGSEHHACSGELFLGYQKFSLSADHSYWAEPATGAICMTGEASEFIRNNLWKLAKGLYEPRISVFEEGVVAVDWLSNIPIGPYLDSSSDEDVGDIEIYTSSSSSNVFSPSNLQLQRPGEKLSSIYASTSFVKVAIPKCSPAYVAMRFKVAGLVLDSPVVQVSEGYLHTNSCSEEAPASDEQSNETSGD